MAGEWLESGNFVLAKRAPQPLRPAQDYVEPTDNLPESHSVLRGEVRYTDVYGTGSALASYSGLFRGLKGSTKAYDFNVQTGAMGTFDPTKDS